MSNNISSYTKTKGGGEREREGGREGEREGGREILSQVW